MRFHPTSPGSAFFLLVSVRYLSSAAASPPIKLNNIPYYRRRALAEAQLALTDYLHLTRSLPFALADHIASNSPLSLHAIVSQIPYHGAIPSDFGRIVRNFLAFHPVNEFDFFFESIGLSPSNPSLSSRTQRLYLSDDAYLLPAVSCLLRFGFPWPLLGRVYLNSRPVLSSPPAHLLHLLQRFEGFGFPRLCVIAICITFPSTLLASDFSGESELLLRDLKVSFVDYDLAGCAGDDIEVLLRFCRTIRVFYDFGSEKGSMGDLMGRSRRFFVQHDEFILADKLRFLLKLGIRMEDVGTFTLKNAEMFDLDLGNTDIVIPDYLIRVGLSIEEADSLVKRYPYVTGKNKIGNLPGILKILDLNMWFLTKIVDGKNLHFFSASFIDVGSCNSELEAEFLETLERIKLVKRCKCLEDKLEFLLSIGYGKNKKTLKIVGMMYGKKELLQERFDCLIGLGLEYSMLCKMITVKPNILNHCKDILIVKANYLLQEMGYPLEYLYRFPAFLCCGLDSKVKPRYRILNWLRDNGLVKVWVSPRSVLAISEKRFIYRLSNIHPAAPKQWLEYFSSHKDNTADKETI